MESSKINIGFSTGSIALGDFKKGISCLKEKKIKVIELSALRESELSEFQKEFEYLDLDSFNYISFHAPSKIERYSEREFVDILLEISKKQLHIVVHPDVINDFSLWNMLGSYLCIENMDKRKSVGKTTVDLEKIFEKLPHATFCFDVAHAKQIDFTMVEAKQMLTKFSSRLKQIHLSDVNSQSKHETLSLESLVSYGNLFQNISHNIPIILESPIDPVHIESEMQIASLIFNQEKIIDYIEPYSKHSTYFRSYIDSFQKSNNLNKATS